MCLNKVRHLTRKIDIFSVPISLTYKKEDSFSTVLGGLLSILAIIILGGFFITETVILVQSPEYSMT